MRNQNSATRLRLLLISSVLPDEQSLGGSLVLKRHLSDPALACRVFRPMEESFKARLFRRLSRTFLRKVAHVAECFSPSYLVPSDIDAVVREFHPNVILSVAHGWHYLSAARTAVRWNLPFVLLCQDWWPDKPEVAPLARPWVEDQLRKVCRASQKIVCVSEGMLRELGSLPNSVVIHDLPSKVRFSTAENQTRTGFKIIYAGNLYEYGPMIEAAVRECRKSTELRLEVFGPNPWWSDGAAQELRSAGLYHGLVPPDELLARARHFDAALVAMSFDVHMERRMKTSFPSKLIEMAQLEMPLVVWGPEYCSAVQWARKSDSALCVTEPAPQALRAALESLAASSEEHRRLSNAARDAACREFNPDFIHADFVDVLAGRESVGVGP